MSLLDRFVGHREPDDDADALVAADSERPLSLQVLFAGAYDLDPEALTQAIRAYHPDLAGARVELLKWSPPVQPDGTPGVPGTSSGPPAELGLAGWGPHVIKLAGFPLPIPQPVFEACVQPAHF